MTTNTAAVSPPARQDPRQVTNTLKKTVTYSDVGIGTGIAFDNSIPAGAFITGTIVDIVTAFDGGGEFTVGTNSSSYNNLVAAGDVDEAAAGVTGPIMRGAGRSIASAADVTPKVMMTGTLTQGEAVVLITYEGGFSS